MGQSSDAVPRVTCEVSHLYATSLQAIFLSGCNPPGRPEVQEESPGSLKRAGKERSVGVVKLLTFTPSRIRWRELLTSEHGRAAYRSRGVLNAIVHSEAQVLRSARCDGDGPGC